MVQENIGRVFEESDGAVVFRDEEEHTRVFINSQGLPTYEAKDLGLAKLKKDKYPEASTYLIITANEVNAYFNVVLKALGQIDAELADKTKHLSHGLVKLPGGKMSSRTGDVVLAGELLENTLKLVSERSPEAASANDNALAAIKYAFLKQNIGGDVVYSAKESVNLEGQTGPYVQYAGVRINSILAKIQSGGTSQDYDWQAEQPLLWLVAQYPEVTKIAAEELAPHGVSQYLYELAREFNRYYESTPVKDAPADAQAARVQMLSAVLNVLELGLSLLNISMPSRM
jgi:arginyl-tRNA synthetase